MSDQDKEENLKEFLDFYNAIQSKRYFLSDPKMNPFSDSKLIKKNNNTLGRLEDEKSPSKRLSVLNPITKFGAPGRHIKNIDEDSNKLITSQNNWIPERIRLKQMERETFILNESVESIKFLKNRTQKKLQKLIRTDYDIAKVEETLGKPRYQICGCCMVKYLLVNLPYKVSNKAIMDARKKWKQQYSSNDDADKSIKHVVDVFSDVTNMSQMNKREVASLYQYSLVCVFCAQFFNDPEEYRPSYCQVVAEEKLEHSLLQQKQNELKWDPLELLEADRKMQQLMEDMS